MTMPKACGVFLQVWVEADRVVVVEFVAGVCCAGGCRVVDSFFADPAVGFGVVLGVECLPSLIELCFELFESARGFPFGRHGYAPPVVLSSWLITVKFF